MASLQLLHQATKSLQHNQMKLHSGHLFALTLLIPTFRYLYLDYRVYLALGPGGTPATILGYLRVKFLGLFALSNPYEPPQVPLYMTQKKGLLSALPKRKGPRPTTVGIAPHRQTTQRASPDVFAKLSVAIKHVAQENKNIEEGTSCFEKHGPGLFSTYPLRRTCRGEICHAHPSDGSLHLTLHPADAKIMLEAGWGERHPLARGGWLERFVPCNFVMLYGPRNEDEVAVVLRVVQAAAWWVGGEEINIKMPDQIHHDTEMNQGNVEALEARLDTECRNAVENQELVGV